MSIEQASNDHRTRVIEWLYNYRTTVIQWIYKYRYYVNKMIGKNQPKTLSGGHS